MKRILIVDDEINVLHALQRTLRKNLDDAKPEIEIFTNPRLALERGRNTVFDIVISDFRMPEMNGIDFLKAFKEIQSESVRLVLSASTDAETLLKAINQAEVFRYLTKPWQDAELKEIIETAFAHRDQVLEEIRLFDELRVQFGKMTPQELEAKRLEADEPGITKVDWGPDGSVPLD